MTACGAASPPLVEVRERVAQKSRQPVDIRLLLRRDHERDASRYMRAAAASVTTCADWLGGFDEPELTLVDPDLAGRTPDAAGAIVLPRVRWWTTPTSMAPELAAARAVIGRFWSAATRTTDLPPWFVDGVAEHVARRVVAPLFELENNPPGYAFLEERYFDGFVPRFLRIRLMVETDGWPLSAYRSLPQVALDEPPRTTADREALSAKAALTIGTLEHWLGRPAMDEILSMFADAAVRGRARRLADFEQIASDASGQDLSWFFDQTFRSARQFDYGISDLASTRDADGSVVTTVTARRYGDAVFSGTSAPRVGPFESGRGMTLLIMFADGRRRTDHWDGRDREKMFRYRSEAQAISAVIDPDRTLLLDVRQTNNSRTLAPRSGAAVASPWAVRYGLWLQDLLLTYASLV